MFTKTFLHHFEAFMAVAQTQSFTQAAIQLGYSKAAISQSIRLLEESLQLTLFIRSTRRVILSEEGELLLAQCQRLQNELDLTFSMLSGLNSSPNGTLRISCNVYFAQTHLLTIIQKYIALYPKMNVELQAEERMPNMQKENVDIVFGINWAAPDDVVAKKYARTRYVICASPAYLQQHGTPCTLKDLEKHCYIPHLGRSPQHHIVSLKKPITLHLRSPLKLNNAHLMKQCALNGFGIIQVHEYMVSDEIKSGQLVEILSDVTCQDITLYIYYQKHRFVQPKIRQFVNLCETAEL